MVISLRRIAIGWVTSLELNFDVHNFIANDRISSSDLSVQARMRMMVRTDYFTQS